MDDINRLNRDRKYSTVTEEERALIDEAVAAGRVTRVPMGSSAFSRTYVWNPKHKNSMKLQEVDDGSDRRPGHAWRRQVHAEVQSRRRRAGS